LKKTAKVLMATILSGLLCLIVSCAGTEKQPTEKPAEKSADKTEKAVVKTGFSDVQGKTWQLSEIKSGSDTVVLDRAQLEADNLGDVYSLKFDDKQASGKAAPNTYRGPYTLGEGDQIAIGNAAATLMAAVKEPEALKEHEYFAYLAKVNKWGVASGLLSLWTADDAGSEVVLVFAEVK
jgi:heat shock protein HslJ